MLGPVEFKGYTGRIVPVQLQPFLRYGVDQKPWSRVILIFIAVNKKGKVFPHQRFADELCLLQAPLDLFDFRLACGKPRVFERAARWMAVVFAKDEQPSGIGQCANCFGDGLSMPVEEFGQERERELEQFLLRTASQPALRELEQTVKDLG